MLMPLGTMLQRCRFVDGIVLTRAERVADAASFARKFCGDFFAAGFCRTGGESFPNMGTPQRIRETADQGSLKNSGSWVAEPRSFPSALRRTRSTFAIRDSATILTAA